MKQRTQSTLAALCGVSRPTIAQWQARPDWPGNKASDAALKRYAAAALERSKAAQSGPHADLKRAKLEKQIRLLTAQAARAEHEAESARLRVAVESDAVVTVEHFREQVLAVQSLCLSLWESAATAAATKRKDAQLLGDLRAAMDDAKIRLLETVDADAPASDS